MNPGVWEIPAAAPPLCSSSEVDGEMWCYQKPGFEALLLAELQRQQQRSQFCDTLLKADGVLVPAHSCVLSAISPNVCSALSSTPPPPAGQSRLLEFQTLGTCTLLHMVRLLYSGEMAGEGEKEKQEAISAAANLGIHGLVEVPRRDGKTRDGEGGGRHVEVGVQTEPMMLEENEGKRVKWRREVRDGCTFLWKEMLSDDEKDMCTQTEEVQGNTAPSTHSAISIETHDMAALQNAEETDSQIVLSQIPHIPISLLYTPENQINQPSSAPATSTQDSTAADNTSGAVAVSPYISVPLSLQPFSTLCATDLKSWCTATPVADRGATEGEEWQDEQLQQFQGNIPGFINYFLNPDKEEGSSRRRAGQRRGAGVRRARRARAAERRAGRTQARTGGRWRGRLTQTVDVQHVGVSKVQKLFLQRWGRRSSRAGQGGGAAGRKLYLKTREFLKSAESYRRGRGRGKVLDFSKSEEMLPQSEAGGGGATQRGQRTPMQHFKQDGLPGSGTQKSSSKSTASCSSTSVHFYNIDTLSSPHLQPSPSPLLQSPAASYMPPASSLLHTTPLPPPGPPPHEDQPEQIDRLLEEVMMGLDILPKSNSAPGSTRPRPTRGSSCAYVSSGNSLAQNKRQVWTTGAAFTSEASTHSSAQGEVPVLQQQGEGELNDMLDHFLQSFEQHVENCRGREEEETNGESSIEPSKSAPVLSEHRKTKTKTKTSQSSCPRNKPTARPVIHPHTESQQGEEAVKPPSRSQRRKASAHGPVPPQRAEETSGNHRTQRKKAYKRRKRQYFFSLEKKRVRKSGPMSDAKIKIIHDLRDKQLQQIPVVKLERGALIPVRITLQGHSCQRLEVKSPAKRKNSSSSVRHPRDSSEKSQSELLRRKTYPIRSRLKEGNIMDGVPFLYKPLVDKQPTSVESSRGRSMKNGDASLPHDGSSTPVQLQTVERGEAGLTVQPQEEDPTRRGKKRRAESEGETRGDAKRICFEPVAQPTSETCTLSSESTNLRSEHANKEAEEVIDVETISLTSVGDCLEREESREIKVRQTEGSLVCVEIESSADEVITVDGDTDDGTNLENDTDGCREPAGIGRILPFLSQCVSPPTHSAQKSSTGSTGSREDEDIDVIGESSPIPEPVIISLQSSDKEDEDEDIDVVGEKKDYASSEVFAIVNKGELLN
ncbi:uncharacterized protein [Paralichthys olivaceus]|uniref:uncharacterized protein isoform X1 n=2 Tax=Paralichthys olivaceus TaxID=8255 RepID=UPI003751B026